MHVRCVCVRVCMHVSVPVNMCMLVSACVFTVCMGVYMRVETSD